MSSLLSTLGNDAAAAVTNFFGGVASAAGNAGQSLINQALPQQKPAPQPSTSIPSNTISDMFGSIQPWQWVAIGAVLLVGGYLLIKTGGKK